VIRADDIVVFTAGLHEEKIEAKLIYLRKDWEEIFRTRVSFARTPHELDEFCCKVLDGVLSYNKGAPMVSAILGESVKHFNIMSMIRGRQIQKGDKVTFRLIRSENVFFANDVKLSKKFV